MTTVAEILHVAQQTLADGVDRYKHLSSKETKSTPAAPNTGSFRATQSAMVELRQNHRTYDGMFLRDWPVAAIVGSIHPVAVSQDIFKSMVDAVSEITEVSRFTDGQEAIAQAEDGRVHLVRSYGTNYTTVSARQL